MGFLEYYCILVLLRHTIRLNYSYVKNEKKWRKLTQNKITKVAQSSTESYEKKHIKKEAFP